MKEYNHEQRSPEWYKSRAGCITGSMFSSARYKTKKGDWSSEARKYAFQLAMERLGGKAMESDLETWAMRRGKELEPMARKRHGEVIGQEIKPCGFFTSDDGRFGTSPDGLIGDDGVAEYKCLVSPDSIYKVVVEDDLSEYIDQIQGHLWITDRKWCDFVVYLPQLAEVGRDIYKKRIVKDSAYVDLMSKELEFFDILVRDTLAGLRENIPQVGVMAVPF